MIITFLGHSSLNKCDELFELIKATILNNIDKDKKNVFYCGGYGNFDEMCREASYDLKKDLENIEVVFVSPYFDLRQQSRISDLIKAGVYDLAIYPELEKVPLKFAISYRNQWMIEKADLIIAYVDREYGGAYKALGYAKRNGKRIINLAVECTD